MSQIYTVVDGYGNKGWAAQIDSSTIEGIFLIKVLIPFLEMMQQSNIMGAGLSPTAPAFIPGGGNPTDPTYNNAAGTSITTYTTDTWIVIPMDSVNGTFLLQTGSLPVGWTIF